MLNFQTPPCFLITIIFIFLTFTSMNYLQAAAQEMTKSARLLDLIIRDHTFRSYSKNFRTGKIHRIYLPANLSGIDVDTVRFRCGSLKRYGAKVREFGLNVGVHVQPCSKRVMLVRQNLGSNWSSLYYDNYELSGYRFISPVLGLLAYNVASTRAATIPSELSIQAGDRPITIDFSRSGLLNSSLLPGIIPLCASFDRDGRVTISRQARPSVCAVARDGHFGLVVESPLMPVKQRRASKWKIAIGSTIGAALGAALLSLLLVAMFVNAKKKARMEEMERRAYEEEALQVSMVGHVRAVAGGGFRAAPVVEHDDDDDDSPN